MNSDKKPIFKKWWFWLIVTLVVLGQVFKNNDKTKSSSSSNASSNKESAGVETTDGTKSCLVGFDWVYPSSKNPTGAWKFSSDGTFISSTTMFGGMSTWGNWEVLSPGKIKISYTRTSEGVIPDDQVLTMSSCSSLKVGSTLYSKD